MLLHALHADVTRGMMWFCQLLSLQKGYHTDGKSDQIFGWLLAIFAYAIYMYVQYTVT